MTSHSAELSSLDDKATAVHAGHDEKMGHPGLTGDAVDFSMVDEKKTLRKMDIRLIPMLALL